MIPINEPEQLAAALHFLRSLTGLSQRAVAAAAGFQQVQIHHWETDERRPQWGSLIRLLKLYGARVVITLDEDPKRGDETNMTDVVHKHDDEGWHRHPLWEYGEHRQPINDEKGPYQVLSGHPAQLTDGFHTMQELYDHRLALTAALATERADISWRSKAHHPDDDPIYDGYFIIGMNTPHGTITYHYQLDRWDVFADVPELEHAPKWDGAGPEATVTRLLAWARDEFPVPVAMTAQAPTIPE